MATRGHKAKANYTANEIVILKQYADVHCEELLPGCKHQLSPLLQEQLGMNGPNPRHTVHSVHAKLRSLVAPVGMATGSILLMSGNPWMQLTPAAMPFVPAAAGLGAADPRTHSLFLTLCFLLCCSCIHFIAHPTL